MARRSILQTLRQPALVIPPIVFPLLLWRSTRRPERGDASCPASRAHYLRLRDRGAVHPGLAVRVDQRRHALARDVETASSSASR
jgi:hypothetical protein